MELIIRAPMRYVQFPGALDQTGRYIGEMGRRVLVVCTDGSKKRFGARLDKSLAASGKQACCSSFSGACTLRSVEKATEEYKASGCDMIAGVGGGQTIDTARAAANALGAPLLILPTVASNDAPGSALSILHAAPRAVAEIRVTKRNPTSCWWIRKSSRKTRRAFFLRAWEMRFRLSSRRAPARRPGPGTWRADNAARRPSRLRGCATTRCCAAARRR